MSERKNWRGQDEVGDNKPMTLYSVGTNQVPALSLNDVCVWEHLLSLRLISLLFQAFFLHGCFSNQRKKEQFYYMITLTVSGVI